MLFPHNTGVQGLDQAPCGQFVVVAPNECKLDAIWNQLGDLNRRESTRLKESVIP